MIETKIEKVLNKLQYVMLFLLNLNSSAEVDKAIESLEESKELLIEIENQKKS